MKGLTLERQPSNLFTVANLPVVINSVDKPNIRVQKVSFAMCVCGARDSNFRFFFFSVFFFSKDHVVKSAAGHYALKRLINQDKERLLSENKGMNLGSDDHKVNTRSRYSSFIFFHPRFLPPCPLPPLPTSFFYSFLSPSLLSYSNRII